MEPYDENERFLLELGTFISNFHGLEFLIRLMLYEHQVAETDTPRISKEMIEFKVGDETPENALTDYSSLDILIQRFNNLVGRKHPELRLDVTLPKLRDAVAHGRVAFAGTTAMDNERFLVKFTKPKKRSVKVEFSEIMSANWLQERKIYVESETQKVLNAMIKAGLNLRPIDD